MNLAGWFFLGSSWLVILGVLAFCLRRLLGTPPDDGGGAP